VARIPSGWWRCPLCVASSNQVAAAILDEAAATLATSGGCEALILCGNVRADAQDVALMTEAVDVICQALPLMERAHAAAGVFAPDHVTLMLVRYKPRDDDDGDDGGGAGGGGRDDGDDGGGEEARAPAEEADVAGAGGSATADADAAADDDDADTRLEAIPSARLRRRVLGALVVKCSAERGFAEVVLCALRSGEQRSGRGSRLMRAALRWVHSAGVLHVLTYADNFAIPFFKRCACATGARDGRAPDARATRPPC
jgi:GNAT superfamily N-acetyltransferase